MPYESAYPLTPDVDPGVIRARANSSSRKKPVVTFISGDEAVVIPDKSIAGVNKPLSRSDRSEIELDSFAESLSCTMHSTWLDKRALEHRYVSLKQVAVNPKVVVIGLAYRYYLVSMGGFLWSRIVTATLFLAIVYSNGFKITLVKICYSHKFTFTFVCNLTENGVKIYERLVARKISYGISENTPSHLGF